MPIKEDFEKLQGMISSVRIQYILDKYLKKIKLPRYRGLDINEEDFKEILNRGYFTSGDLAQYYTIRKGKIPTALNQDFERLVYSHKGKAPAVKKRKTSSAKEIPVRRTKSNIVTSISPPDFDNKKDVDRYFEELTKYEEKDLKKISKDLIAQGFAQPKNSDKKRILSQMKKNISNEISRIVKDSEKEFKTEKRTVPMYARALDAENYDNEKYLKNKDKFFKRGVEMGKTRDEKMKALTEGLKTMNMKQNKQKPVTKDDLEKIRKLVKAMTIKEEEIKKMGQVKRKRSVASSNSSSRKSSVTSPTSSKSDKSVAGYSSE
jgi:hypothetical protein